MTIMTISSNMYVYRSNYTISVRIVISSDNYWVLFYFMSFPLAVHTMDKRYLSMSSLLFSIFIYFEIQSIVPKSILDDSPILMQKMPYVLRMTYYERVILSSIQLQPGFEILNVVVMIRHFSLPAFI